VSSRSLNDLTPQTKKLAEDFLHSCEKSGIEVLIYCTLRTKEEQDGLYDIGRKTKGTIVTNARGGDSWHNYGCAFDYVPLIGGKPQWSNTALYAQTGQLAESVGLEWAGRWTGKLRETAHCQFRDGKTIEQMKGKK